jgi:hypothetical protein
MRVNFKTKQHEKQSTHRDIITGGYEYRRKQGKRHYPIYTDCVETEQFKVQPTEAV